MERSLSIRATMLPRWLWQKRELKRWNPTPQSRARRECVFWSRTSWTICFQNKIQTVAALEIKIHGPQWRVQKSCKAHWHLIFCQKSPKCQRCYYPTASMSHCLHTSWLVAAAARPEYSQFCFKGPRVFEVTTSSQPLLLSALVTEVSLGVSKVEMNQSLILALMNKSN